MQTAFLYHRVSTNAQDTKEQVKCNRQYAQEKGIQVLNEYGDHGKRHHAYKRPNFQQMLADSPEMKPNFILVQRLDRFGVKDINELGYFLTILEQNNVRLVTTIDGEDHSSDDIYTAIMNTLAASQSRQEQIDKADRVLFGKRRTASQGEYIGSKYLTYGFDLVCIGRDGNEKWRLVEDSYVLRVKYVLTDGQYLDVEPYGNEVWKDPDGVMPDTINRFRPHKEKGERLFCFPSIRKERLELLRRMCEMFADGWTTHRIAQQFNKEGNRPVYHDHWYSPLIDGLLANPLLIGMPTWNRSSQSGFKHIEGGKIVATDKGQRWKCRKQKAEDLVRPDKPIFDPIIPIELWEKIQALLDDRKRATPRRLPRNEELWFGGLWVCGTTGQKLAGDANQKCFRVKHLAHQEKKLTFKEAERFIGQWLAIAGKRIEVLDEAVESNRLLEKLTTNEWLVELRFDYIRLEIENFLVAKLGEGHHTVGNAYVTVAWDNEEGCHSVDTDGDYLELYCAMVKDDMANNRQTLLGWLEERDRLTAELIGMKNKDQYIIDTYTKRIGQLSKQIKEAADPPKYNEWWQAVQEEVATIREQQERVTEAIRKAEPLRKAQALRQLIDHIVVEWATAPTSDRRHKGGVRTYCKGVRVIGRDGQEVPIMTNDTSLG